MKLIRFYTNTVFKMESRYTHTVTKAGYLYPAPLESSSFPSLPWKNVCRNVVGAAVWFITYLVSVIIRRPNVELRHDQRALIELKKPSNLTFVANISKKNLKKASLNGWKIFDMTLNTINLSINPLKTQLLFRWRSYNIDEYCPYGVNSQSMI